jgi:MFS family permease
LVAGLGLGGELGAAVTLVSELLPTARRGLGTMVVAGCGLCGGIAAAGLAEKLPWRSCYALGGGLGLLLLLLRTRTLESPLFLRRAAPGSRSQRGDLRLLLCSRRRRQIYLRLVLTGVPIWFVAGILMVFAPEFGRALGIAGITAPRAVLSSYLGVASGDFLSGLLSQLLRSRKWAIGSFLALLAVGMGGFLGAGGVSPQRFYAICFALGIGTGYWAVLVTTAAEHFGTNLRATVATTVPNLIRAAVIPLSFGRQLIERSSDRLLGQPLGLVGQSVLLGGLVLLLALWALAGLDETFGRSLDFDEQC